MQAISGDSSKPALTRGPGPVSQALSCSSANYEDAVPSLTDRDMLKLNPNDNQGNPIRPRRSPAARRGEASRVERSCSAAYEDEGRAYWLYTRALLAFREGGGDDEQAVTLVKDAWSANEHVPAMLAGIKPPVFDDSG